MIEKVLFLTVDKERRVHCYTDDPERVERKEDVETDLVGYILDKAGVPSDWDPSCVVLKVQAAKIDRGRGFDISAPGEIRRGARKYISDETGLHVEIDEEPDGTDPACPLVGRLRKWNGEDAGTRHYALNGECEDGIREHRLMVRNGDMLFGEYDIDRLYDRFFDRKK